MARTLETDLLSRARMRDISKHKEMVENHTEPTDLPIISKTFTIMKFLDQFPTYLRELHGVNGVSLSYVLREPETPQNSLPLVLPNRPWSGTRTNMMDELILFTPHSEPSYDSDNARVFSILSLSLIHI